MSWFKLVLLWLGFADVVAEMPQGEEAESPGAYVTLQNGKRLQVSIKAKALN